MAAVTTGVATVAAVLLAIAGLAKLRRPASTATALRQVGLPPWPRAVGLAECLLAAAVLLHGAWPSYAALGICYLLLAGVAHRQRTLTVGCGCFGTAATPTTHLHVGVNLSLGAFAAGAAVAGAPALSILSDLSWGMAAAALVALAAAAATLRLLLTELPTLTAQLVAAADALRLEPDA